MEPVRCFVVERLHETTVEIDEGTVAEHVWRRVDTGETFVGLRDLPAGGMWFADWMSRKGPDGRCLVVRLPNGHDWLPDYRATNCDRPADLDHRCWCRHGEPPDVTVDKSCDTCTAGSGSIGSGEGATYWHGFLRDGYLVAA